MSRLGTSPQRMLLTLLQSAKSPPSLAYVSPWPVQAQHRTAVAPRRQVAPCKQLTKASLAVQVLGTGSLRVKVTVAATQFSGAARTKIEEAGGSIVEVPEKIKWTRAIGKERKATREATAESKPKAKA